MYFCTYAKFVCLMCAFLFPSSHPSCRLSSCVPPSYLSLSPFIFISYLSLFFTVDLLYPCTSTIYCFQVLGNCLDKALAKSIAHAVHSKHTCIHVYTNGSPNATYLHIFMSPYTLSHLSAFNGAYICVCVCVRVCVYRLSL